MMNSNLYGSSCTPTKFANSKVKMFKNIFLIFAAFVCFMVRESFLLKHSINESAQYLSVREVFDLSAGKAQ